MTNVEKFIAYMKSLPEAKRKAMSEDNLERTELEHSAFIEKFYAGLCYLCDSPIKAFHLDRPCMHWFLKPKSIRKKDIEKLFSTNYQIGFMRLNTYLRWVANSINPTQNINDVDSLDQSKMIEETIVYKNLEWSFSCSISDFEGHSNAIYGQVPHYHMQMRADEQPFFRFNDFHIPLTEEDIIWFKLSELEPLLIKRPYAEGMKDVFDWANENNENALALMKLSNPSDNEKGALHFQTLVFAPEGEKISGNDIYNIIQRAKEKKTSMSHEFQIAPELNKATIKTFAEPGDAVPELATRSKRRKNT